MPDPRFGLYIHWPFCQAKCPYCDFNSHVVSRIDQTRWAEAYVAEIARLSTETPDRQLDSVFFGGGTPSLMAPGTVAAVLDAARTAWRFAENTEITLEANPTSVEAERFAAYREAGVNRLSLGVQALNDSDLRRLGRLHSAEEAQAAFAIARATFPRVSFDLIYARQDQTPDEWRAELAQALALAVDHISLYQLTIEPGTAFGARHELGRLPGLPRDDDAVEMYDATVEMCTDAGLPLYEISNFAGPGAESRHNLIYWTGGDYVGIGPGAHGRLTLDGTRWATEQIAAPGAWLDAVRRGTQETRDRLPPDEIATERLLMGLRLTRGIARNDLEGLALPADFSDRVANLQEIGLLLDGTDRLSLTANGRHLLDSVLRALLV